MTNNTEQMSREEIMRQLPEELTKRSFSSVRIADYQSTLIEEQETGAQMLWNRFRKNPFVPIGLVGTVYFLSRGILNMGNKHLSQKMMRGRVLAQGFTLAALVIGFTLEAHNQSKKSEKE